jgi:hypothetical protein
LWLVSHFQGYPDCAELAAAPYERPIANVAICHMGRQCAPAELATGAIPAIRAETWSGSSLAAPTDRRETPYAEDRSTMSKMLTDTMNTARNGMESAKEGTMHTVVHVLSMIVKGASVTAGIMATLRQFDRDDGLAWFGLARRRSPLVTVAILGAGAAVGAGIALLFAPESGADLRSTLMGRSKLEIVAKKIETKVEDAAEAAVSVMKCAADDAKHAIAGVVDASHNGKPASA